MDIFYLMDFDRHNFQPLLQNSDRPSNPKWDFSQCQLLMVQRLALSISVDDGLGLVHRLSTLELFPAGTLPVGFLASWPFDIDLMIKPVLTCFTQMFTTLSVNLKEFILEHDDGQSLPRQVSTEAHNLTPYLQDCLPEWGGPGFGECYGRYIDDHDSIINEDLADREWQFFDSMILLKDVVDGLAKLIAGRFHEQFKQELGLETRYPQLSHLKLSSMVQGEAFSIPVGLSDEEDERFLLVKRETCSRSSSMRDILRQLRQ